MKKAHTRHFTKLDSMRLLDVVDDVNATDLGSVSIRLSISTSGSWPARIKSSVRRLSSLASPCRMTRLMQMTSQIMAHLQANGAGCQWEPWRGALERLFLEF